MPAKKGETNSAQKDTKKKAPTEGGVEKKSGGPGRKMPKRAETYSVYIYRVLK